MKASWTEASRTDWETEGDANGYIGHEKIAVGALQRIANATEKMAVRHRELIDENDYLRKRVKEQKKLIDKLIKGNAALRGVIKSRKAKPCG